MPFSPEEITTKRFVTRARGYDRSEVEAFLRAVAVDYRAALQRAEETPVSGVLRSFSEAGDGRRQPLDEHTEALIAEMLRRLRSGAGKRPRRRRGRQIYSKSRR